MEAYPVQMNWTHAESFPDMRQQTPISDCTVCSKEVQHALQPNHREALAMLQGEYDRQ